METKFDLESIDLGSVKFDTEHTIEVHCISGCDNIHYIDSSCYCTNVKYSGNVLTVTIDIQKAVGALEPGEQKASPKYVQVFLDEKEPHFIPDPLTKKMIFNNNKKRISLPINFMAYND